MGPQVNSSFSTPEWDSLHTPDGPVNCQNYAQGTKGLLVSYDGGLYSFSTQQCSLNESVRFARYDEVGSDSSKAGGYGKAMLRDDSGNFYFIGETENTPHGLIGQGLTDVVVTKYDSNMNWQWSQNYGSSYHEYVSAAVFDSSTDQILIVGSTGGEFETGPSCCGYVRGFVLSLSVTGARQWTSYFGPNDEVGVGQNPNSSVDKILVDSGVIYVAGNTSAKLDGSDTPIESGAFVASLDMNGNMVDSVDVDTADAEVPRSLAINAGKVELGILRTSGVYHLDDYEMDLDLTNITSSMSVSTVTTGLQYNQTVASQKWSRTVQDSTGNTYEITSTSNTSQHIYLKKYDVTTALEWTVDLTGDSGISWMLVAGLVLDSTEQPVITFTKDFGSPIQNWVYRYSVDGDLLLTKQW